MITEYKLNETEQHFLETIAPYILKDTVNEYGEARDIISGCPCCKETDLIDSIYNYLIHASKCQWRIDSGYIREGVPTFKRLDVLTLCLQALRMKAA